MWHRIKRQEGQALVEFALIVPVLLLLICAIIDFGIIISGYNTCANMAREGARAGAVGGDISAAVNAVAPVVHNETITVTHGASGTLQTVRVDVSVQVRLVTGMIIAVFGGNPEVPLSATSTMYVE